MKIKSRYGDIEIADSLVKIKRVGDRTHQSRVRVMMTHDETYISLASARRLRDHLTAILERTASKEGSS